jgi:8-oxo-dGTP diphosphatase
MKKEVDVVAALIAKQGKVFLAQRRLGDRFALLWEFPGGKVEPDETQEQALKREIKEELDLDIKVGELISIFYDELPSFKIKVYLYRVTQVKGSPFLRECRDWCFIDIDNINTIKLAPVDRKIHRYLLSSGYEESERL